MISSLPSSTHITYSAITLPRCREDILTRYRLLSLLNGCLERKLVLLVTPAGYGKTSLLLDFAHQKDVSACWYSVDRYDQDPERFLAHFMGAIARVYPDFKPPSSSDLTGFDPTGDQLETVVNVIVNEIYGCTHKAFWIMLDDFHVLADQPAINSLINRFICRAPENCHLVIATRHLPVIPDLELYKARGQVAILGAKDLAFIPEEVRELSQKRKIILTIDQSVDLVRQTEGWITGILLTSSMQRLAKNNPRPGALINQAGLTAYWNLVFDEQPAVIQKFLLFSSPLGGFDASLCERILESEFPPDTNWLALLETILHNNLFVRSAGENSSQLYYHNLFQEYLRARLERDYPGCTATIQRRILDGYKASGNWDGAYHLCQQINDVTITMDIIELAGPVLLNHGRFVTLSQWLEDLPPGLLAARPGLLSLQGAVLLVGNDIRQSLDLLNQAAALHVPGDRSGRAHTLVFRSSAHYSLGDYPSALADADESLALAGEEAGLAGVRAQALRARGASLLRLDRCIEGLRDIESSLAIYQSLGDESNIASLHQELGLAQTTTGDLQAARGSYLKALEYWRMLSDPFRLADLQNSLGVLNHQLGDYERAFLAFDEGLKNARRTGYSCREAFILTGLGDLLSDLRADQNARDVFEEAQGIAERIKQRYLCFYLDYALACLSRQAGDLDRARRLSQHAASLALPDSNQEQGLLALESARQCLAEDRVQQAISFLNAAVDHFRDGRLAAQEILAYLLLAAAFLTLGDEETSRLQIKIALDKDLAARLLQILCSASREIIPALECTAKDAQIGVQTGRILERLRRLDERIPEIRRSLRRHASAIALRQPRIAIQAFGAMQVAVDGRKISGQDWKSQQQRDLLFYLLQHNKGANKERMDRDIWGSVEENSARLRNALYKIRQSLGPDVIIYQDGLYFFNPALDYEYDVENFRYHLAQARAENADHMGCRALQRVVDLYQGDYAVGAEGFWVVAERERLYQEYLWAVASLVERLMGQGQYTDCRDVCLNAIELDPLQEEFYRLAMRVAFAEGDCGGVHHFYQLCRRALNKPKVAEPSDQTYRLYKQLTT